MLLQTERLSCSDRFNVCCADCSASKSAFFLCALLFISGWLMFGADAYWANNHLLKPYRLAFVHVLPGIVITFLVFFLVYLTIVRDAHGYDDPFGDQARQRYYGSLAGVVCCLLCTLVPLVVCALIVHATWYDPSTLGTIPPSFNNNNTTTTTLSVFNDLEEDEGLRRGIFSSISGHTKTTTPPPTTTIPPARTWPPYEGPDAVPVLYVLHIVLLCGSSGFALLAGLWRAQERRRSQELGEDP